MFYCNIFILFISNSGTGTSSHLPVFLVATSEWLVCSLFRRTGDISSQFGIYRNAPTNDIMCEHHLQLILLHMLVCFLVQSVACYFCQCVRQLGLRNLLYFCHCRWSSAVRGCWPSTIELFRILKLLEKARYNFVFELEYSRIYFKK